MKVPQMQSISIKFSFREIEGQVEELKTGPIWSLGLFIPRERLMEYYESACVNVTMWSIVLIILSHSFASSMYCW